jgi:hypothetical protein
MFNSLKQFVGFVRKSEERRLQEKNRLGKIIFGFVLIPVIIGFCVLASNAFAQSSWTKTMASVVKTRIEAPPPGKSGFYALVLTYSYEAAGKTFRGSGPVVHDSKVTTLEHKQLDEFPEGTNIQVSYNPSDPSQSCLARGANGMPFFFLLFAGLLSFLSYKLIRTKPLKGTIPSDDY